MTEIGGFSAARSSQERDALVLLGEEHGPVGTLCQGVDVGWGVLKATLLKIVMLVYLRVSLKVPVEHRTFPVSYFFLLPVLVGFFKLGYIWHRLAPRD